MDPNTHQQAYDRGSTIFSPDGRLYQVEYAREAVERGAPSVGVVTDDGVVLAARKRLRSPLLEAETVEKLYDVDDHLAVAAAGHAADARQLVDVARRAGQRQRLRYGEPIGVAPLATRLADHVQEHTQTGGSRPYGSALLVAGVDPETGSDAGSPRLYEVDPGGTSTGWRAAAIGHGADERRRFFEEQLPESSTDGTGRTLQRGATVALEALAATAEDALTTATVDLLAIDSTATIDRYSTDDLEATLADAGVGS
ncbi:archaeal proteasome endopeptidase complex subunit alpha [Halopiger djelfimassiliensis]|uniref:archaeal proteasome endopeptidase complex subunit alpha n=1 Tax=Halopiger djelfimassiliensis TaxID=1293047 RepID=UPI000677DC60|nr:archaeal proteasome endopeptidase complex subunit alpha [Halopiger djelfimassiliensis]